jgi:hypothetical protein
MIQKQKHYFEITKACTKQQYSPKLQQLLELSEMNAFSLIPIKLISTFSSNVS